MATYRIFWWLRNQGSVAIDVHNTDRLRRALQDPCFRLLEGRAISVAVVKRDMRSWMWDTIDCICRRPIEILEFEHDARGLLIGVNTKRLPIVDPEHPLNVVKL